MLQSPLWLFFSLVCIFKLNCGTLIILGVVVIITFFLKIEIQFHCLSMKFRYHIFIWQSNCRECDITWQLIKPKTNMSKIYENFFGDLFVCPRITFLFIRKQESFGLLFSTSENTVYVGIKSNFAIDLYFLFLVVNAHFYISTFSYFHIFIFSYFHIQINLLSWMHISPFS